MHVFAEIYLTFQYEESTMEICSLVSAFEPSALKERAKKKKCLYYCKVFVSLDEFLLELSREICQLSEIKKKETIVDSL